MTRYVTGERYLKGLQVEHIYMDVATWIFTFFPLLAFIGSCSGAPGGGGGGGGDGTLDLILVEEISCFNTIFEISCSPNQIILFEAARYGRNDSTGASRCEVPFTRSCDVDVQYPMSRACGGRRKCSIAVNTAFFGDPCGYEEFLKVAYRCIPSARIHRRCPETDDFIYLDRGYIASPNYPGRYYMDVECHWRLAVQPHQFIRLTIYDFELDVKRDGRCDDFLEITSQGQKYFKDCGTLGKQVIDLNSNSLVIWFRTGQTSLTQRGFILYMEAIGTGCKPIPDGGGSYQTVVYQLKNEVLTANVTCFEGHRFVDDGPSSRFIQCLNDTWNAELPSCLITLVPTTVNGLPYYSSTSPEELPASFYGIVLGIVVPFLLLLLTLLFVFAICSNHRRQPFVGRKSGEDWRMVVNNLQDNFANDVTKVLQPHDDLDDLKFPLKVSDACAKRHNTWTNRNFLLEPARDLSLYGEEDERSKTRRSNTLRCAICWRDSFQGTGRSYSCSKKYPSLAPSYRRSEPIRTSTEAAVIRDRAQSEYLFGTNLQQQTTAFSFSAPDLTYPGPDS